ncbi:GAF domain-containing protein [Luteolibacter arcticus]|uniref:GAF domain-containing protein n=1 Tax=Luteolibacter arcticus TaxID=1581411 RepID=A0ABT3GML5_9BACT|nr:GAF domain-containing protein [Luteolibacter arcticus]MCW1924748.1 GAF domain-containing protein [Luteolibacter arcticus]
MKSYGVSVYACNPLMAGGELLGTLSFASRTRTHFDADELEFLETITHSFAGSYMRWRLLDPAGRGPQEGRVPRHARP